MHLNSTPVSSLLFVATSLAAFHNHTWGPRDGIDGLDSYEWTGAYYRNPFFPALKKISGTFVVPNIYDDQGFQFGAGISVGLGFGALACRHTLGAGIVVTKDESGGGSRDYAWVEMPGQSWTILRSGSPRNAFHVAFSQGDPIRVVIDRTDVRSWIEHVQVSFENLATGAVNSRTYTIPSQIDLTCLGDAEWVVANVQRRSSSIRMPGFGILAWTDTLLIMVVNQHSTDAHEKDLAQNASELTARNLYDGSNRRGKVIASTEICPNCVVISNVDSAH